MRRNFLYLLASAAVLSLASCTTTKFVPDGSYLLDEVKIRTDPKKIYGPFFLAHVCSSKS